MSNYIWLHIHKVRNSESNYKRKVRVKPLSTLKKHPLQTKTTENKKMDTTNNTTNTNSKSPIYSHTINTTSNLTNFSHINSTMNIKNNDNNKKQKRRRRMVKNEIVKIDDIDEEPGLNFSNWIRITKQKLLVCDYYNIIYTKRKYKCIS